MPDRRIWKHGRKPGKSPLAIPEEGARPDGLLLKDHQQQPKRITWGNTGAAIGSAAGFYDDWQAGRDPAGISTQEPELAARLDPIEGGRRLSNYLRALTLETQTLARACGKSHVHNLEPEDLVALTLEASAMARVPLAGTNWIPGTAGA